MSQSETRYGASGSDGGASEYGGYGSYGGFGSDGEYGTQATGDDDQGRTATKVAAARTGGPSPTTSTYPTLKTWPHPARPRSPGWT